MDEQYHELWERRIECLGLRMIIIGLGMLSWTVVLKEVL